MLRYLVFFLSTSMFVNGINWHSSQIILRHLYDLQDEQFAVTKEYLKLEIKRLNDLQRFITPIFDWYINYSFMKDTYILSHIDSIKLMSRVYNNLSEIKKLMSNKHSMKVFKQFDEHKAISELNIQSAYRSLRRIQKVYAIPASDMAAGKFKDRTIGDPMDACECYVMSKYSFEEYDTYSVIDWTVQTYNKWLMDRPKCVDIDKLHHYIKAASMSTGFNFETLSDFSNLSHPETSEYFAQHFSLMENALNIRDVNIQSIDIFHVYDNFEQLGRYKNFRDLCRTGKSVRPLTFDSKCRYQTKNSAYWTLMPFKEEDISINPSIKLYHDIIYDEEIKIIKKMASEDLIDAAYYFNGKIALVDDLRLGQLKWFSENSNPVLFGKLNDRIECITEYSTNTAEGYQAVNYGLGGHFSEHVDAFTDGPKLNGNRLVTILFYMTDVPEDGYTVFPNINFVAHCRKGSALVWQNLYLNNGSVNSNTLHGGCPVMKGNKWVMTKGLYEEGQNLAYTWQDNKIITIV
ncbi:prolyl 4-hydroxylase subunit alpha-3-like [Melanaphis sacchari]|uniref:procollagen-proline 4-dioxygenase n=1 Tax=Melanaphis sacchari TaxID=742174 RepID=A0A2H8TQ44_9HEMI|nr:prolyl 4-hydroxylase subunit alpha-3-like [Melanaphis sacchari]